MEMGWLLIPGMTSRAPWSQGIALVPGFFSCPHQVKRLVFALLQQRSSVYSVPPLWSSFPGME